MCLHVQSQPRPGQQQQQLDERQALHSLLTAIPQSSSAESLIPALQLANAFYLQAKQVPSRTLAGSGGTSKKPGGILGALGQMLHGKDHAVNVPPDQLSYREAPISPAESAVSRASANGDTSHDRSESGTLTEGATASSADGAATSNGNETAGPAEAQPESPEATGRTAQLTEQQRAEAVACHDALISGIALQIRELMPEHSISWCVPTLLPAHISPIPCQCCI